MKSLKIAPSEIGPNIYAGALVALIGIPQCLAYSVLSGLPPIYGLTTAVVPGIVAALLSRNHSLVVGPTNTTGIVVLSVLSAFQGDMGKLLSVMAALSFLVGAVRIIIALIRLEKIFYFIPYSVLTGFSTAAALVIGLMQIDEMFGWNSSAASVSQQIKFLAHQFMDFDIQSLKAGIIATSSAALILLSRKWNPRVPYSLIILIAASLLASFLGGIPVLGDQFVLKSGWPDISYPFAEGAFSSELLGPSLAIAVVGCLELIVTLQNQGRMSDLRDEIRNQGIANMLGSFAGSFPASSSLTRSALVKMSPANNNWATISIGLFTIPIILFGDKLLTHIPMAVIAGVLVATAISMVDVSKLKMVKNAHPKSFILFLLTFLSAFILPFYQTILVGGGVGILFFLVEAQDIKSRLFGLESDGKIVKYGSHVAAYLEISGSLFFAAAPNLVERIVPRLRNEQLIDVYLSLRDIHHLRLSGLQALHRLQEQIEESGMRVHFIEVDQNVQSMASRCEVQLNINPSIFKEGYLKGRI